MAVLVTGATGFIAQWVLHYLLKENYQVIGTVRSQEKGEKLHRQFGSPSNLSFEIVKDISDSEAFEPLFKKRGKEIEIVLHTASPFHFNTSNYEKDLLIPAVNGTKGILNAIKQYGDVKKVVVTSSYAAIADFAKTTDGSAVLTEKDWNSATWEGCQTDPVNAYCASKKFAEEAAWTFARENKTSLTTINPVFVFGPQKFDEDVTPQLNTSNEIINGLLHSKPGDKIEPDYHSVYVDVRDVARAHLVAFQKELSGERLGLSEGRFCSQQILDILNEKFPQLNISKGPEPGKEDTRPAALFDNSRSKGLLGFRFIGLEQSVYDTVAQVLKKEGKL
ncbi:methylglyoxal reductase (NADPH-dependent) gre2 [Zygosaccharomyces mellis]|uniref:Methylglyoxal reductase (NADPH-dependent) gre2 n=1 Tax=Zygosaccharomyces mellis TaxID=42258 RepID=A0A4C2ECG7_9SACH|nr:methylglyoxal reductase (NADPH-dependent) gre2 [Zygosaccharomyces mellis]